MARNNNTSARSYDDDYPKTDPFLAPVIEYKKLVHARAGIEDELLRAYEVLLHTYRDKNEECEREKRNAVIWEREQRLADRENSRLRSLVESNGFAYVVVDGDGAVFNESFIAQGEEGGNIAAHQLLADIEKHIADQFGHQHLQVFVQVICNLDGLSRALVGHGALDPDDKTLLARFARGFCRAQALFSFTDVGYGKERADNKVRKVFEVMEKDLHCRAIFLAGCHDNGYAPWLESFKKSPKICLLETTPAASEMRKLSFPKFSCPNVFRTEPLSIKPPPGLMQPQLVAPPVTTYSTQPTSQHVTSSPVLAVRQVLKDPASASSPQPPKAVKKENDRVAGNSWATVSATAAAVGRSIDISAKKTAVREKPFYLLNKNDQRLDAPLPKFDAAAREAFEEKVRKNGANFCNRYHILGTCKQFEATGKCPYVHAPALSPVELAILRSRARGLPCQNGEQCRDFYCTSGHHCPNSRMCWYDEDCRFHELHGIDLKPTVKRFEDGTSEVIV